MKVVFIGPSGSTESSSLPVQQGRRCVQNPLKSTVNTIQNQFGENAANPNINPFSYEYAQLGYAAPRASRGFFGKVCNSGNASAFCVRFGGCGGRSSPSVS